MHRLALWFVLPLMLLAAVSAAAAEDGRILVLGTAEQEFTPEVASVSARFEKRAAQPGPAAEAAASATSALVAALEEIGVPGKHIQATGGHAGPVHEWDAKARRQQLVGYQASREIRVSHLPLARLGAVMQAFADAGVEHTGTPVLDLGDRDAAQRQVLQAAAADARRQAVALAKTLGVKVGRPLAIDADPGHRAPSPPVAFKAMRAEAAPVEESYSHPGLIQLDAQVRVAFAIQ